MITLVVSLQIFVYSETRYYSTGEIEQVGVYVNGNISRQTFYHKSGNISSVKEYVNGKISKQTDYNNTFINMPLHPFIKSSRGRVGITNRCLVVPF
ncbi:MAG TPA: hypothetical protein EYM84_05820, partial [Flavobacteriales bacterium]|nr:hypothetical protein [Flavobacteriales bacterium]